MNPTFFKRLGIGDRFRFADGVNSAGSVYVKISNLQARLAEGDARISMYGDDQVVVDTPAD